LKDNDNLDGDVGAAEVTRSNRSVKDDSSSGRASKKPGSAVIPGRPKAA